jgi:hypothetical protein
MSGSNGFTGIRSIDDGRHLLSSTFLEFCVKVRNNDPSILPELGKPFNIRRICEREYMELADALLENTSVTYQQLMMKNYTKSSAEAMAKYVRTSKRLQRVCNLLSIQDHRGEPVLRRCEEILCCFLSAIQESTSLKELYMELSLSGRPSNLALENMLTHTQSLQSLSLIYPPGLLEDITVAATRSGLQNNNTLRELTLDVSRGATTVSPILTSLRDHPLLRRLCVRGNVVDLTGLETVLLSKTSKITELEIDMFRGGGRDTMGLTDVLQALARRPTLAKLILRHVGLGDDQTRELGMVLCKTPSLQSLVISHATLGSAGRGLSELAPALYRNTSIKVLDMSWNNLNHMESAGLLRDLLCSNKTTTTLDLTWNTFGRTNGAVECIADGLGSNSTLLNIDLSSCALGDDGVSVLAQTLGSRNTTIQKLTLGDNSITATVLACFSK